MDRVFDSQTDPEALAGGVERAQRADASGLPCLYSNNCTEQDQNKWNILTGAHKKTAHVLFTELIHLATEFGIEKLGFLTLTFADNVRCIREAQKRFHSLNSHVLKARYARAVAVWERQKSGRIHFHLVVVLTSDIRTGFDFSAIEKCDYRSANHVLRSEWAFWRKTAPRYRFGRTELLPVKSTAEGIARYVGKYVSKHIGQRDESDKGARVVRFLGYKPGDRKASSRFAWASDGSWLWRHKLKAFCKSKQIQDTDGLKAVYGPRWAYLLQSEILGTNIQHETYPSYECFERDLATVVQRELVAAQVERLLERRICGRTYILKDSKY